MQGEVLYNGKPLNKRAKRQVGYVMQDDLLYESLTVYETVSCMSSQAAIEELTYKSSDRLEV